MIARWVINGIAMAFAYATGVKIMLCFRDNSGVGLVLCALVAGGWAVLAGWVRDALLEDAMPEWVRRGTRDEQDEGDTYDADG